MRERRSFNISVWCASATPNSNGPPGVLDGTQRRGARPAIVTADQHHIRISLGHAGGDRAHAGFGHQFHADFRARD